MVVRQWLWFLPLMLMVLFGGASEARTPDVQKADMAHAGPLVQILDGRIAGGLQFYRISGLTQGAKLYIHADATSGYLDPLIAILRPDVSRDALSGQSLDEQIKTLSRDHDPLVLHA